MYSNNESFKTHEVNAPPAYRSKCRLRWGGVGWKVLEEPNNLFARPVSHHGDSLDRKKKISHAIKSEAPILNGLIEGRGRWGGQFSEKYRSASCW
ncbi:hypothetical protein CEXT_535831 [Caerostris extrusa]|uniref:Uncharacterized protein n=1 Tax=Caerostris extrusa TaxID=172846 RepID=A0AAV4W1C7_CAEEX|nr:hypothetical protein CEXT_535831 [Caerostris extrusa]